MNNNSDNKTAFAAYKLCLLVVCAAAMTAPAFAVPKPLASWSFNGCTSSNDCGLDECCVLGQARYSEPTCQQMGADGEVCRPRGDDEDADQPRNVSLTYPDGTTVDVSVHDLVCPCAAGLDCSGGMTCVGLDGAGRLVLREDYTDVDEINHL